MKKTETLLILLIFMLLSSITLKADILVTNISDTTIVIPDSAGQSNYFLIDLNNDTIPDFKVKAKYFLSWEGYHPPHDSYEIAILGLDSNMVSQGPYFANDTIHNNLYFEKYSWLHGGIPGYGPLGRWPFLIEDSDTYAFVGLKFIINNEVHFGWLRLKTDGTSFTIESYAYNRDEDEMILAGQTN